MRAYIAGIGSYAPDKVLTNPDLEKIVDTSDEWITTRSGIKERRIAAENQAASDLALIATQRALKSAGIKAEDIGEIIVGTATPDMPFPSTACLIQKQIGAPHVMAFDISAGCTGFLYALGLAEIFIKGGNDNILVIGADILSKFTDYTDRTTCVLFGDGAGALIVKKGDGTRGILSSHFASDGSSWQLLHQPAGGSRMPASIETVEKRLHVIKMQGNEVFKLAVRAMSDAAVKTLRAANVSPSEVKLLIPHQANIRIIEASAKRLHMPMDKVLVNLDRYGNTSTASIPLALDEAVKTGRIDRGDIVLMIAFGAGFTWGGVLFKY
ncbi:MAG: ketoacyl-ACP synthase III [candidate division WOR-3 bacterium]|nr:MAG: ketoacyl-ACP synthase III [candidate division WOR-3 bacterium]